VGFLLTSPPVPFSCEERGPGRTRQNKKKSAFPSLPKRPDTRSSLLSRSAGRFSGYLPPFSSFPWHEGWKVGRLEGWKVGRLGVGGWGLGGWKVLAAFFLFLPALKGTGGIRSKKPSRVGAGGLLLRFTPGFREISDAGLSFLNELRVLGGRYDLFVKF